MCVCICEGGGREGGEREKGEREEGREREIEIGSISMDYIIH